MRHISAAINKTASRNIQRKNSKMVNASSAGDCEKEFLSSSSSAEKLEQNVDVLLLDQVKTCVNPSQIANGLMFDEVRAGRVTTSYFT